MKKKNMIRTFAVFVLLAITQVSFCGDTYKVAVVQVSLVNAIINYSDGTSENVPLGKMSQGDTQKAALFAKFLNEGWLLQTTIKEQNAIGVYTWIFSKKE
ncbi:MAG TPA: hypothetical protein VG603_12890 [Chitinophagales bacterium]|nr:hypothetical protein [Chitinophagales bacterium]